MATGRKLDRAAAITAAALIITLLPATAASGAARRGTFAGSLGISVPRGGHGAVRAVNRATGAITAAKTVGRSGRFSLSLPGATYLVVGTVITAKGKVLQQRIGVSLRPGQKRTHAKLNARKRKRKRRRKARRGTAHAAFTQERGQVTPGRIAVEIPDVTGSSGDPELDAMRAGINDMLTHDVMENDDCGLAIVEVDRRADILKELEFQQSPYVDPSTRVTRNFIVGDVEVRGTLSRAPGGAKVALTIVDKRTGKKLGTRETTFGDNAFSQLTKLGKDLADDLCKLSDVYEITLDVQGEGRFATHSSTGTIHRVLQVRRARKTGLTWTGTGPFQWDNVTFTSKMADCSMIDHVIPAVTWTVTLTVEGEDQLEVDWGLSGSDGTTASIDCRPTSKDDPDPPPVPGQPGTSLLNTGPTTFTVPFAGATRTISGGIQDGGDGFFDSGSIKVTPAGVG